MRAAALLAVIISLLAPAAQAAQERGYIELSSGIGLRYTVLLPEGQGPFPVLLQYQGYGAGSSPNDNGIVLMSQRLLDAGFAILGVNLRGTGCSEGSFDLFEDQWVEDGLEVIDWASRQPWSNGDIAMIGLSFPGMTQWMLGPKRPPALKALLPWSSMSDLYRDVGYPGGIFNISFATGWTGLQKSGHQYLPAELQEGNSRCLRAISGQNDPDRIVFLFGQTHPWSDHFVYERFVPEGSFAKVNVPVLLTHAWQDEQISSRVSQDYEQLNPETTWHIYGNGAHGFGLGSTHVIDTALAFLLHFMKGEDNGFEKTPHVQIQHEVAFGAQPRWISSHPRWPAATRHAELYFTPEGTLAAARPQDRAQFNYNYPQPAPSMASAVSAARENQTYQLPVPPGGAAVFTSPALSHDVELLGPTRVDLWLSSSATDTDLQASLTEVRADGKEMFVQRGWLRASHRKMDLRHNQTAVPYHTHTEADSVPLSPGTPTPLSIEIWPVGHVFRAGSSLRISIEAPVGTTGFRQLEINPTPAINTVHVGGEWPSRVTLTLLPGSTAVAEAHDCNNIINQPCRNSSSAQPAGELSIPAAASGTAPEGGTVRGLSDAVRITNSTAAAHYLRAVTLALPDSHALESASLRLNEKTVTIKQPLTQARFELPEVELAPGSSLELPVLLEQAVPDAAALQLGNPAHAGPASLAAPSVAAGSGLLVLCWTGTLLLLGNQRRRRLGWALVLTGVLVACGGNSSDRDGTGADTTGSPGTGDSTRLRVVSVELVDAQGSFVEYRIE